MEFVDHAEGAVFRSAYMTAWNALNHGAHLRPGEVLLSVAALGTSLLGLLAGMSLVSFFSIIPAVRTLPAPPRDNSP